MNKKLNLKILLTIVLLNSFIACVHTVTKPVFYKPQVPSCTTTGVVMQYKNYISQTPPRLPKPNAEQLIDILFCLIEIEQAIDSLDGKEII